LALTQGKLSAEPRRRIRRSSTIVNINYHLCFANKATSEMRVSAIGRIFIRLNRSQWSALVKNHGWLIVILEVFLATLGSMKLVQANEMAVCCLNHTPPNSAARSSCFCQSGYPWQSSCKSAKAKVRPDSWGIPGQQPRRRNANLRRPGTSCGEGLS
jgi:hypothetical protein